MGTPKTLDEALAIVLGSTNTQNLKEYPYAVIKDFLAQRFGVAILNAADDEKLVSVLQGLFESLTKRTV